MDHTKNAPFLGDQYAGTNQNKASQKPSSLQYITPPEEKPSEGVLSACRSVDLLEENFEQPTLRIPDLHFLESKAGTSGHLLFFYNLIVQSRANRVLEIGVGGGLSSLAFLCGVKELNGLLVSIDIQLRDDTVGRIRKLGLYPFWKPVVGLSGHIDTVTTVSKLGPFDVLFIDGDHTFEGCSLDYRNFVPMVRMGGYILIHDTISRSGVWRFVQALERKGMGGCNFTFSQGLYVLRKLQEDMG
jgi:predicted O-methyltransferase YrrM